MRFVNITPRNVCTPIGCLRPGAVSADGGRDRDAFEKALARVVGICGNSLGVRLNEREASLPIATRQWPYYSWSDLRSYYIDKIKQFETRK